MKGNPVTPKRKAPFKFLSWRGYFRIMKGHLVACIVCCYATLVRWAFHLKLFFHLEFFRWKAFPDTTAFLPSPFFLKARTTTTKLKAKQINNMGCSREIEDSELLQSVMLVALTVLATQESVGAWSFEAKPGKHSRTHSPVQKGYKNLREKYSLVVEPSL